MEVHDHAGLQVYALLTSDFLIAIINLTPITHLIEKEMGSKCLERMLNRHFPLVLLHVSVEGKHFTPHMTKNGNGRSK